MSEKPDLTRPVLPAGCKDEEEAKAHSCSLSVREGMAWSVMWGFGESYVSPFAIALSAGNFAMALLGTIPPVFAAFAQMAGASITERLSRRKPYLVACTLIHSLSYLPLFIIPYLCPSIAVPAVIAIFTLMIAFPNMGIPAWVSLMGDIVPAETRGSYFGKRQGLSIMAMVLSMNVAAFVLYEFKHYEMIWVGFGIMFTIALLARGLSAWLMSRQYEPACQPAEHTRFSLFDFIIGIRKSNFARFTFAMAVLNGATSVAGPFVSLYMLRDLNWTYMQFAVNVSVFLGTQALVMPWWGRICDKHGTRVVIMSTSVMLPLLPFIWVVTNNFYILTALQIVAGVAWAGFAIAGSNFMYDAVPSQKRPRAFSYFTLVSSVFGMVGGAVIGARLAEYLPATYDFGLFHVAFVSSLPAVFVVSAALRALAGILFLPLYREVRPVEAISKRGLLLRVTMGEPLVGSLGEVLAFVSAPLRRKDTDV